MSRTIGGYLFCCKICGEQHLLCDNVIPEQNQKTVAIPCVNNNALTADYTKSELKSWSGSYWDVFDKIVKLV